MLSVKGIAAALCLLCVQSDVCAAEKPGRLELVGTNVISLGTYPNTEERTARVRVRNAGQGPLRIERVITACKCLRTDAYPKELAPGQTGEVAVSILKNEIEGAFNLVFFVDSSDPVCRIAKVHMVGEAKPLFAVTCAGPTALGPVEPGLVWTGRYTVAATEAGLCLEAPALQSRGTRCEGYEVKTNAQEFVRYDVTEVVVFEGDGAMESVLSFPVRRADGKEAAPVRLKVEAVRKRRLGVVPDVLAVPRSGKPVKRRLVATVDTGAPLDPGKLLCRSALEPVGITAQPAKSGKGFVIELVYPAESIARLHRSGGSTLSIAYESWSVDVPVRPGN